MNTFVASLDINCEETALQSVIQKTCSECPTIAVKTAVVPECDQTFSVTFSSSSESITSRAEAVFRFLLPANAITNRFAPNSQQSLDSLSKYCSDNEYANNSFELITKAFNEYKPEEICVAFNGGKDCTALLHIVYSIFVAKYPNNSLNTFYISIPESFPSLENFVRQSVRRYNLNLISYSDSDFKKSMQKLKNETKIKAILMGTRASDLPKHVVLNEFQMTDEGWPQFMRISPLLKWSYSQIWAFIRDNHVLYCSLYDRGYTSIGSTKNTAPNPLLKFVLRNGETFYMPAFMLTNEDHERKGRTQ
ncbi:unnamed protein product [Oppiella nova]|uniref:FAD synthase n=1 Tax=Oppiella nova TaxID=334625 RepID=A0A7R9LR76_9ACAR|nr:unnamed protein product [Oppiella nova]CAG2165813.1 unnamed protein product [Oppiella nova]